MLVRSQQRHEVTSQRKLRKGKSSRFAERTVLVQLLVQREPVNYLKENPANLESLVTICSFTILSSSGRYDWMEEKGCLVVLNMVFKSQFTRYIIV